MRTNIFWILFILICACTSANAKAARKGPSEFRFRAELKGDMAKDTLYQVRLTADVLEKCTSYEIRRICFEHTGLITLLEDGIVKVIKGLTTFEEIRRQVPYAAKPRPIQQIMNMVER